MDIQNDQSLLSTEVKVSSLSYANKIITGLVGLLVGLIAVAGGIVNVTTSITNLKERQSLHQLTIDNHSKEIQELIKVKANLREVTLLLDLKESKIDALEKTVARLENKIDNLKN